MDGLHHSAHEIVPTSTKFRKKWMRSRVKLAKEGFKFQSSPSPFVVIANAGLGNGIRRKELEDILEQFESLTMPRQKSYALVVFKDGEHAKNIVEKLQGHIVKSASNLASPSVTLYFHYSKDSVEKDEIFDPKRAKKVESLPGGLIMLENFISLDKEKELIDFLEKESPTLNSDATNCTLKHRLVWHYGYEFRYQYSDVDPEKPLKAGIPPILKELISKIMDTGHVNRHPDQVTINKYEPGQGIPPHVDNVQALEECLVSLSLKSQTVMDLRHQNSDSHAQILLKPRSLLIFTGASRYEWTHGICPRKIDLVQEGNGGMSSNSGLTLVNRGTRFSITFRKVRDDYKGPNNTMTSTSLQHPVNEKEAEILEEAHVHKVYNEIASHFTSTRDKPWPKVKQFIEGLEPYSLILDVGCGSGRYLGVRSDVYMAGCDRSESLIKICKEKGFEVFTCDGLNLSVRPSVFDACICIAVIHHYSTNERRLNAIRQLLTIVRRGGKILISVWALEQEYKRVKSKYLKKLDDGVSEELETCKLDVTQKESGKGNITKKTKDISGCNMTTLPIHKNRTPFRQQDVLVPWHRKQVAPARKKNDTKLENTKTDKKVVNFPSHSDETNSQNEVLNGKAEGSEKSVKTFHRYYHVFKKGELTELCETLDNVKILDSYYDEGNWCVILEKV